MTKESRRPAPGRALLPALFARPSARAGTIGRLGRPRSATVRAITVRRSGRQPQASTRRPGAAGGEA